MQEYRDLIEEYLNESSTQETKQKALIKAIYSTEHFRNMIKNHEDRISHLFSSFKIRQFNQKDIIYRSNQNVKEVYWILEGQMSCWDKKTEQDINTEMKLNGVLEQFLENNNMNLLTKDQLERYQNIQIRLNFLRDLQLDQMIRDIDVNNQYFLINNICNLKRVRFLEQGEIAGENCAISGQKYDGLCIVSSEKCYVLSLSTENYNTIFNMNKENFYFIKDVLQTVFGFANQKLITRLAYQFEVVNCQYNQVIYSEGDQADCIYIIKSGEVEIVQSLNKTQQQSLQILTNNQQKDTNNQQNQQDKNAEEINFQTFQNISTNEAAVKQTTACEFSKYKRKIKPKVMETQIVLKNQGILGLEDYEVEVTQVQPEKDLEESLKLKKQNGAKSLTESTKKQKLRYVKAISKSNETVLLRIRDKYIDTLLREQGINRSKISEKLKMQKQQYHSERLQKLHEYKNLSNQSNITGQGGNSSTIIDSKNLIFNNNTLNNIPPTRFSSNSANNFNFSKDSDDNQKNLSTAKRYENNQTSLPHLIMKSQVHFGVQQDRMIQDDSNYSSSQKTVPRENDDIQNKNIEITYSTPQMKSFASSRSAMKHLSQLDLRGNNNNSKLYEECNSAEPTPTVYSRNNNKRFTDYSASSTATTASLNSMQKLSPTLSIPINPYVKHSQIQQQYPNNSGAVIDSPIALKQDQQRIRIDRLRPGKAMSEIHHYNHQSYREESSSPMPYLNPIVAAEKSNSVMQSKQQKIINGEYIQDTNIFDYQNTSQKKTQSLQSLNQAHQSNNKLLTSPQKVQLDLLFLLPEKTKLLNQKRLMRQESMMQQKGATPKLEDCCKKKVNFENSGSSSCKMGCSLGQKSSIVSLAEIDYQSQQQQMSIQEYLPEQIQTTPKQDDKKVFINRLKGIHPILKKCKTLVFTEQDSPNSDESINEQQLQQNQQQDSNSQNSFTQCLSHREFQSNPQQIQTPSKIQIKQFNNSISSSNDTNNINNISCTPILKPLNYQKKQNLSPNNNLDLNTITNAQTNNTLSTNQPNQKSNNNGNGVPISIMSYSKQNEDQIDFGYQQNKQKSIFLQPRSKNVIELLRRNNYRVAKSYSRSTNQKDQVSKSMQIKHDSQQSIQDYHPIKYNLHKSSIQNLPFQKAYVQ